MRRLLFIILILSVIGTSAFLACSSSDDDDDDSDDDAADDDTGDDTGDDTAGDDTHSFPDDDADDTAADDDSVANPWVDGGFSVDSWEPCSTTGCQMFVYATVSDVYQMQQMSNLPTGGPIEQMVVWQMAGDTAVGDTDLTITPAKAETISTFIMIYVNATIVPPSTINYDALYISTAGTLHIDAIGQTAGDTFTGELQDVTFTEAELQGSNVLINFDGKSGTVNSITGSGTTLRLPMK
jgi:hypothetical protein